MKEADKLNSTGWKFVAAALLAAAWAAWGFRGPDRAIQPVSEARDYAGRQRGKAQRCLATSGSGGNPPEWFRELTGDIAES